MKTVVKRNGMFEEKKEDILLTPLTNASIPSENESQETKKKLTKTSIKQRLRTDLGRSVIE